MHLGCETTNPPDLYARSIRTLVSQQAFFIFALEPRQTRCLAGEQSPSFNPFLIKPYSMQEDAIWIRALSQNVERVAEFLVSQNLHEGLGWADDGIKTLAPTILQQWIMPTCGDSH
jgi:hypothetical protein